MKAQATHEPIDEPTLIKLYMELTGATELGARSVLMHVWGGTYGSSGVRSSLPGLLAEPQEAEAEAETAPAHHRTVPRTALWLLLAGLGLGAPLAPAAPTAPATPAPAATNSFWTQPLSLADAINLALQQNPTIQRAQKDIEATQGVVIQTRAIALPRVNAAGNYSSVQETDVDRFRAIGVGTFGQTQNWQSQIKLIQSIYEGGRILSAFRAARLTREQSLLNYQTAVADTVLAVQIAFYDVLLAAQQITVREASVELLTRQLADTTRRYDAGTVPRFNVLRAEVELANARPPLIQARNRLRISKNNLATLLGMNVPQGVFDDIPLNVAGKLTAEPYDLELPRALSQALEQRTELKALQKAQALRREDITTARAGYKPSLQAFGGYDAHNSQLTSDLGNANHGWIIGAQASWNLFDGLATQGRVKQATALYERAGVDLDDATRRIELDVRTSYSSFIEAREVLESQTKVLEQAEEALRLATARYEAGTGTQLDVLSAQTALTDARTTQIQALHDYEAARARLERAVGTNVQKQEAP